MPRLALAVLAIALAASTAAAQEPRFEVASIRPYRAPDDVMFAIDFHEGGRLTAIGTLPLLIRAAYRLQEFELDGASGWMRDERFAIDARAAATVSDDELRLMLRALLEQRFALTLRQDARDMPIYALRVAAAERLKPASETCGPHACSIRFAPGALSARGVTMASLAGELSMWVDRPVIDRSAANGKFDVELEWMPDSLPQAPVGIASPDAPARRLAAPPSIFTAVREQLGLSLQPERGDVDVFVIESAERPAAN